MSAQTKDFYEFDDFRIDLSEKVLLRDEKPVSLTPKVFDTLLVFLENPGRLIEKDELMERLWHQSFVEESNLSFNIMMLRKALGDSAAEPRYIETVPKRGYRFIGKVQQSHAIKAVTGNILDSAASNAPTTLGTVSPVALAARPDAASSPVYRERNEHPRLVFGSVLIFSLAALVVLATSFFTSNGETYFTRFDRMKDRYLSVEKLSNTGNMRSMNFSPDGRMIAYLTMEGGRSSIWLRQLATGKASLLIEIDETVASIGFSQDGEFMYFGHARPGEPLTLSRIPLLGGAPTRVFSGLHSDWTMSPDGRQIAYGRNVERGTALMVADLETGNEHELFTIEKPRNAFGFSWAPDGASIAYYVSTGMFAGAVYELFEFDLASGIDKRLSDSKWAFLGNITWLPDRSGLLATARQKADPKPQVWLLPLQGGDARPITNSASELSLQGVSGDLRRILAKEATLNTKIYIADRRDLSGGQEFGEGDLHVAWTPDGRLVFGAADASSPDIWIASNGGRNRKQLTIDASVQRSPVVSPDGKTIVFVSSKNGAQNIWRMSADGSEPRPLTSGEGEAWPVITPNGASVIFNTTSSGTLWQVPIEGGDPVKLCDETLSRIALAPDGKRIAAFGRSGDGKRRLVIKTYPECTTVRDFDVVAANPTPRKIEWTRDGRSLIYENEDLTLVGNLWEQPVDGRPPVKLTNFTGERIFDFSFSPIDGKLAIVRGSLNFDAVLLTGLE